MTTTVITSKKSSLAKWVALTLATSVVMGCANNNGADTETSATTTITEQSSELEKVGYSIGYMMAEGNKEMVDDLNIDTFEMGFRDAYADKEAALTEEQMTEVVMAYQERKQKEMIEKMEKAAVDNKAEGEKFLAENAKKEGVKVTDSGLQYKVLKEGTGASPSVDDVVKVHYEGKLLDGEVFDSSYERDEPAIFAVSQMISGFTEGLQLMKEGGVYELYIPSDIAYGETGNPAIEPNSTLVFKVEMLEINPEPPVATEQPAPDQPTDTQ